MLHVALPLQPQSAEASVKPLSCGFGLQKRGQDPFYNHLQPARASRHQGCAGVRLYLSLLHPQPEEALTEGPA